MNTLCRVVVVVSLTLLSGQTSLAQDGTVPLTPPPEGACLLPSGEWCWSTVRTVYGEPCTCPTQFGLQEGVTQ